MLLYEELLTRPPGAFAATGLLAGDEQPLQALRNSVLVRVDNVADYYAESPQDYWLINRDFPCIASPWPEAFYEWRVPPYLNHNGVIEPTPTPGARVGVSILQYETAGLLALGDQFMAGVAAMMTYSTALMQAVRAGDDGLLAALANAGLSGMWNALADGGRHAKATGEARAAIEALGAAGSRFVCLAQVFVGIPHYPSVLSMQYLYWLDDQGAIMPSQDGDGVALVLAPARQSVASVLALVVNNSQPLHVPFLACSFAACKNVVVRDNAPPPKLSRAQERRHGVPKATFKTLEIQPMVGALAQAGTALGGGPTSPRALHIMRGHFKDFRAGGGLFGRHHGRYWWPMRVRGSGDAGVVVKDYDVKEPKEVQA